MYMGWCVSCGLHLARKADRNKALLEILEHVSKLWVLFVIIPLVAFANAGLRLWDTRIEALTAPATLGIVLEWNISDPFSLAY